MVDSVNGPEIPVNKSIISPNTTDTHVDVQFVVLHYTATTLERTLAIFRDPATKVSSHFVIADDGEIFELVPTLDSEPIMAHHAGRSILKLNSHPPREVSEFNACALGIEIVNLNGNIFPYSDAQYTSLANLLRKLIARWPVLNAPERIVGHEQISGYRGKIDPGWKFDWKRIYREVYPGIPAPEREPTMNMQLRQELEQAVAGLPGKTAAGEYERINYEFEQRISVVKSKSM